MSQFLTSLVEHYHWQAMLWAIAGIFAVNWIGKRLLMRNPTIREAIERNHADFMEKLKRPKYAEVMKANGKVGKILQFLLIFVVAPFSITLAPQPWWRVLLDVFVILMVYDFFYYLTHRFLFHDNGFLRGPLISVHAVHHRQHVPCRVDGGYLNIWEQVIGVGLYAASIVVISLLMGQFHVATFVITHTAFMQINQQNHTLWTESRFPFGWMNYASVMHHNHHKRFTAGNYATISLLYDWLFGTIDHGEGYGKDARR